ncbi:phage portal protein [Sphingomonas sp. PB4P5]|uniref:phage portal protein n=1 Tax=Parasphingomonas puruogangriensis TaxID=3096155 RepID=UPI002FCB378C
MQPPSSPIRLRDGLGTAFSSMGQANMAYQRTPLGGFFGLDIAFAAYLASGMLQKIIDIPAADRTRAWRDWQAGDDAIQLIEAEEKRLQVRAKFKAAEVLRGLGGGALILALPGDPATPAPAPTKGGLQAVNIVSRRQLSLVDIDEELTSSTYGEPKFFRVESKKGGGVNIHPSRVIPFRGEPYPAMAVTVSADDRYWGQCRLLRVVAEVAKSDDASKWFSQLPRKAKLLRFGISNMGDYRQDELNERVAQIALGESITNATIYNLPTNDGAGGEVGGEKIDDYQITWAGIPAVQDMLDQRVAAVADIPFTRLMGRSPAGMNSTGEHDEANYLASIGAGQELETRPCLERLDAVMLPSAGVALDNDQTWVFSALSKPNPKDEAERFAKTADALTKIADLHTMPEHAFNAGAQGVIEANGWLPGSMQILSKMPPEERFGIQPDAPPDGEDPSQLTQGGGDRTSAEGGAPMKAEPRRRAANDAWMMEDWAAKPLYVRRDVLNRADIVKWAEGQGFTDIVPDLHVTITYSETPVDWMAMGESWRGKLEIEPGGARLVEALGPDGKYKALLFTAYELISRNQEMRDKGASFSWAEYQPHISIQLGGDIDLANVKPYTGKIVLGPEIFEAIREK